MSTIFVLTDNEERQGAVDTLIDGLERLWPGKLTTSRALAITTDVPQILDLLTSLANPSQATLPDAGAPAHPPAKKARRQARAPKPRAAVDPGRTETGVKYTEYSFSSLPKGIKSSKSGSLLDIAARKNGEKEPGDSGAPASQPEAIPAGDPPAEETEPAEAAGRKKTARLKPLAWTVLKNGKRLTDPYYLLRNGKLAIGDRLSHERRGLYEVADVAGLLTLKRIAS